MPSRESDLLRLTLTAHEAASEPSVWPQFLAGCARLFAADVVMIQRHYFAEHRSEAVATFGMTRAFTTEYNRYYSRINVWRERGAALYAKGRVILDPEVYPRALLKQSEFYNDCLLPNSAAHSMAGVIDKRADQAVVLTALRADQREGWEGRDRPNMSWLLPHLGRAQQTEERMRFLQSGEVALNALNLGAVLVDVGGSAVFFNRTAEQILLNARDGLMLRNNRIVADDAATDAALQRLIGYAIAPERGLEAPSDVLVPRPSLRLPYQVSASPLMGSVRAFIGMTRPAALVLVTDPELARGVPAEALRQGFGLTPTEAKLAGVLAEGHTLEQAAARLAMRYETARTHLRRILGKTRTSRQAELMKLMAHYSR